MIAKFFCGLATMVAVTICATSASADLVAGYSIGSSGSESLRPNGETLFVDSAAVGGEQDLTFTPFYAAASVLLPGTGLWDIGDTVSITGIAFVIRSGTASGTFTFDIREGTGGTGNSGAGGLNSLGIATASYTPPTTAPFTSAHYVNFDSPVSFVADSNSTTIGINIANSDSGTLGLKAWNNNASGDRLQRYNFSNGALSSSFLTFSVAGTVTAVPEASSFAFLAIITTCVGVEAIRRRLKSKG